MKDHYAMDNNGGLLAFQLRLCGKQLSPQATKCLLAAMLMISVALSAVRTGISISEILTTQNAAQPGGLPYNLFFILQHCQQCALHHHTIYSMLSIQSCTCHRDARRAEIKGGPLEGALT